MHLKQTANDHVAKFDPWPKMLALSVTSGSQGTCSAAFVAASVVLSLAAMSGAKITAVTTSHTLRVKQLYRHSLKNLMNWCVWRDMWIEKGFELRARFDANKGVTDPRIIEKLVSEGEAELKEFTHPDPYTSAPPRGPNFLVPFFVFFSPSRAPVSLPSHRCSPHHRVTCA